MMDYGFSEENVELTLNHPDSIVDGHSGRKIYQRKLNGHILRVVVEIGAEIKRVITVYSSDGARYEV